jgi:hypothetical protein
LFYVKRVILLESAETFSRGTTPKLGDIKKDGGYMAVNQIPISGSLVKKKMPHCGNEGCDVSPETIPKISLSC